MMRRRALLFLLAFGTLAGYGSGFASLAHAHRHGSGAYSCPSWRDAESNHWRDAESGPGPMTGAASPTPPRPVEAPTVAPQAQVPPAPAAPPPATPGPG